MAIRIPNRPSPIFSARISGSELMLKSARSFNKTLEVIMANDTKSQDFSRDTESVKTERQEKKAKSLKITRFGDSTVFSDKLYADQPVPILKNKRAETLKILKSHKNMQCVGDDIKNFSELNKSSHLNDNSNLTKKTPSFMNKTVGYSSKTFNNSVSLETLNIKKPSILKIKVIKSSRLRVKEGATEQSTQLKQKPSIKTNETTHISNTKKNHILSTYSAMKYLMNNTTLDISLINARKIKIPKRITELKKTVIFDLEETLISVVKSDHEKTDATLEIKNKFGKIEKIGIRVRPYAKECLRKLSEIFEVIIWTSLDRWIADIYIDHLDPHREHVSYRIYKESCININGIIIKDLRILVNRNIENLVMVDNSAYSFLYQLDNGIPIIAWNDSKEDQELLNLVDYLRRLSKCQDVRAVNRETFKLHTFYMDYIHEFSN